MSLCYVLGRGESPSQISARGGVTQEFIPSSFISFSREEGFYRINDQRFASPGFSGDDIQTLTGMSVYLLNDTEVANPQFL